MKTYAIDFETYYDKECTVASLGAVKYVHHPRFEALLVSIYSDDLEYVGRVEEAPWDKIDGHVWIAHNASFEAAIVHYYLPTLGITATPSKWIDTQHLAAYSGRPKSLKGAVQSVFGVDLDKQIRADALGKTREDFTDEEWEEFEKYCLDDSKWSWKLNEKLSMPPAFQGLSEWVVSMEMRGLYLDMEAINKHIDRLEQIGRDTVSILPWGREILDSLDGSIFNHKTVTKHAAHSTITERSEGIPSRRIGKTKTGYRLTVVPAVTSLVELRYFLQKHEQLKGKLPSTFNKNEPVFQRFYEKYESDVPELRAYIEFKEINKVYNDLNKLKNLSVAGRYHGSLSFFGAHTGRFSGKSTGNEQRGGGKHGKFNLQNITNGERYGVVMRDMLIAPPGQMFFTADLAQIEARLVAYYAKDWDTLERVREGESVYEVHARLSLGYDGPGPLKKHNPPFYKRAKAEVLSLGYGQGAKKYYDRNRDTFSCFEEAEASFKAWRENKKDVQRLWKVAADRLKKAAQETAYYVKRKYGLDVGEIFADETQVELQMKLNEEFRRNDVGVAETRIHKDRSMRYWGVVGIEKMMPWGHKGYEFTAVYGHGRRNKIYGALMIENLCQAAASDLLHEKLVQMEDAGIDVRMVVHDEIDGYIFAQKQIQMIASIMESESELFPGLPIGCEINIGKTFNARDQVWPVDRPCEALKELTI
jgi:hypothetical protein